ncbi:MAG: helix-turn-helix domain-containing protein [Sphaerochaetaceae bacterium]
MAKNKYEAQVVDNIRRFRIARDLSQHELAALSGLHIGYIGGIEAHSRFPKIINIKKIADALEIDIAYLLSPRLTEQIDQVSSLSESLIEHVKQYLNSL